MKLSEIRRMVRDFPLHDNTAGQRLDCLQKLGFDPGTIYQELEMESPFVDTHQDTSFSNASVMLHSHSFYEILYCCNTCGAEYLVGTERYRLQKGDVIIVPPSISHRPLIPAHLTEPYKRYVLWISSEFMLTLSKMFPESGPIGTGQPILLRTAGAKWDFLEDVFYVGIREAENRVPGWELAVIGNTVQIMTQLYRFALHNAGRPKAETPELMDRVMAYVESHLGDRITLADMSHHFYVSESTISQTFRKKMGVSFYRCVTQRRLIAAKDLIARGIQLETVSRQVGFTDYSSFYRAFRQEYGISPRQYRKLQEGKN